MGTAGRKLPSVRNEHMRALRIENETHYDTRAIRSYAVRCLRSINLYVRGVIRVAYSKSVDYPHQGTAAIGRGARFSGLNMTLTVPRDPRRLDVGQFARVLHHEALHWRGVLHDDMTDDQLYCKGAVPSWTPRGTESWILPISVVEPKAVDPVSDQEKKLVRAKAHLARAERKAKLAQTIVKRWKRRVAAAERALERRQMVQTKVAAGGHGEKQ